MSGHSKWASIKHKKAITDSRRGKLFSKLIKEITVSARQGDGVPETNPRLRVAIERAKAANMPNDNIDRAIKRGTGELPGVSYEELIYEGYGPGKVAMIIEILTDNKNRTATEIRHIFSKAGGNLGASGCVAWMFQKRGIIAVPKKSILEEELIEIALDAGAEDVRTTEDSYEVLTLPQNFEKVKAKFDEKNIKYTLADIVMDPHTTVKLEEKEAEQILKLVDALEEHDDVQNVYANFDISNEILEKLGKQ